MNLISEKNIGVTLVLTAPPATPPVEENNTVQDQRKTSTRPVQDQSKSLREKIINILLNGEMHLSLISQKLGQKKVSGQLKLVIKEMVESKIIEMTIPDKPTSRFQKYLLTETGKKAAKE